MIKVIRNRIERLYAAIGATVEEELTKFPPRIVSDGKAFMIEQDFSGGLAPAEIENIAFTAIHAIAHLKDPLKAWARSNKKEPDAIEDCIDQALPLALIIDLSNRDKHGREDRDGGRSGKSPRVEQIRNVMRLGTRAGGPSSIAVRFAPHGMKPTGDGTVEIVITGEVLAGDGSRIADLDRLLPAALAAWETFMQGWGIELGEQPPATPGGQAGK